MQRNTNICCTPYFNRNVLRANHANCCYYNVTYTVHNILTMYITIIIIKLFNIHLELMHPDLRHIFLNKFMIQVIKTITKKEKRFKSPHNIHNNNKTPNVLQLVILRSCILRKCFAILLILQTNKKIGCFN